MKSKEEIKKWLLENCVNGYGNLDLSGLDFSDFDGAVNTGNMKVKGNLFQCLQKVKGNLSQDLQEVEGGLSQDCQRVGGDLFQDCQKVEGDLFQDNEEVNKND